jgi:hypothetical protein
MKMSKLFAIVSLSALISVMPVVSSAHEHEHRDYGRNTNNDGLILGLIGGALIGGLITEHAQREYEYRERYHRETRCRDVIVYDYYGYSRIRRECYTILVPDEE